MDSKLFHVQVFATFSPKFKMCSVVPSLTDVFERVASLISEEILCGNSTKRLAAVNLVYWGLSVCHYHPDAAACHVGFIRAPRAL